MKAGETRLYKGNLSPIQGSPPHSAQILRLSKSGGTKEKNLWWATLRNKKGKILKHKHLMEEGYFGKLLPKKPKYEVRRLII